MGKKGHRWFSAIKKVFTSSSKDKKLLTTTNNNNEGEKVSSKEKKGGGLGRLKHGSLFIPPLFREPSSIEKILGEIDQQNLYIAHPPPPPQQPQAQPSSSYSERPVSPTPPPQQSEAQPSSASASARPVSPPHQSQAQPSFSSSSARPVSPPQQPQAQPSSSYSGRPLSPPHQSQAHPSSSSSARPVSPPQQPQAQPSSSYRPLSPPHQSQAQPSSSSARPVTPPPQVTSSPKSGITTPPIASYAPPPRFVHSQTQVSRRPKPTLQQQHLSAIRIQAAYRGHMVRRNIKGLTGLVRLQGVVRGQNVKRQTVNAMKQMQVLVRVQTQIQSRRIQTLENQALKRQANNNNDKRSEISLGNKQSEMGDEYWDDSSITKEERDARSQKKVEAVIRRERALAYAYSHKVRKGTPTSAQNSLMDIRTGGYPWWSNWLDRQLPNSDTPQPLKNLQKQSTTTSSRSRTPDDKRTHKQLDHLDSPSTPMSTRSMAPPSRIRTPPNRMMKYSRASRGGSPYSMKDDDSLMSCPQFSSVPHYMSPTVSAKAKARPTTSSNPRDRVTPSTPGSETSKRRFSFPFTPNSNMWKKSPASIGGMSMDSSISVSSSVVGRKPFNRFV